MSDKGIVKKIRAIETEILVDIELRGGSESLRTLNHIADIIRKGLELKKEDKR